MTAPLRLCKEVLPAREVTTEEDIRAEMETLREDRKRAARDDRIRGTTATVGILVALAGITIAILDYALRFYFPR